MAILGRRRAKPRELPLGKQVIGNALVVHLPDRMSDSAQELALAVARDPHHELVVVDLPLGSPVTLWNAVADVVPRGRRGIRLVVGGRERETTALAAQWMAERLERSVVAPDGHVQPGAGGSLFVHSGRGTGWIRFQAGKAPQWEAKRFPRPQWDADPFAEDWPTSGRGVAEPVPGGMWIRPIGHEAHQRVYRRRLIETVPCQDELITVALGCPSAPPLSLDDVARMWIRLSPAARDRVRFVKYGPLSLPAGSSLGQALADHLGERVACYAGMPVAGTGQPDVYTIDERGDLRWNTLVRELGYAPHTQPGAPPPPALLSHRPPVEGIVEVAPAIYWYAPDAVIEVVPSGLWIRPPVEGANATVIRSRPVDSAAHNLMFEDSTEAGGERMRLLAQDVLARLAPSTRNASRVLSVQAVLKGVRGSLAGQARAQLGPAMTESGPAQAANVVEGTSWLQERAETVSIPVTPAPATVVDQVSGPAAVAEPVSIDLDPEMVSRIQDALNPSSLEAGQPHSQLLATAEQLDGGQESDEPQPLTEPRPLEEVQPLEPVVQTSFQPTPSAAASALLPSRKLDQERAWLRRTLGTDYGMQSETVARLLSVHPGFQGVLGHSSAETIADAVAVRLHLSPHGEAIDLALRTAAAGPHVPFARCVVAGLGKLPSYRGPTIYSASPTPAHFRLYRERDLVTEWGFVHALTAPCNAQTGTTDILILSMTARRTKLLEPTEGRVDDRVLYVPGTSFKVLRLREPADGVRGQLLLRELAAGEIGADGQVAEGKVALDDVAVRALDGQLERWNSAASRTRVAPSALNRFGALPGLL